MNKDYTSGQVDDLVEMSNADSRYELYEIGLKAAINGAEDDEKKVVAARVNESHFPESFKTQPANAVFSH